ncbi:DNA-binding domain-containing protein [Pelagibacterium sp.]|uniref:HvfC/BufC N-terminal domain-containing protein n=1 Tax=Pelagibacterium sp. TaxID=1967288 RepID=UPI003A942325
MNTLPIFAQAVQNPELALPEGLTSSTGQNDPLRFAVYRNNVHVSLVGALGKGFPVIRLLVGEEFFTAMSRVFVGQTKPSSPLLFQYGASFADFIQDFGPAASLPYLADIARLEYAWTQAYHAADDPVITTGELGQLTPHGLLERRPKLHPATTLVTSPFPIGSIWEAHQAGHPGKLPSGTAETVLITRPLLDVVVTILPAHDVDFARSLLNGMTIGDSAAASATTTGFDFGAAVVGLISLGAISGLEE